MNQIAEKMDDGVDVCDFQKQKKVELKRTEKSVVVVCPFCLCDGPAETQTYLVYVLRFISRNLFAAPPQYPNASMNVVAAAASAAP